MVSAPSGGARDLERLPEPAGALAQDLEPLTGLEKISSRVRWYLRSIPAWHYFSIPGGLPVNCLLDTDNAAPEWQARGLLGVMAQLLGLFYGFPGWG